MNDGYSDFRDRRDLKDVVTVVEKCMSRRFGPQNRMNEIILTMQIYGANADDRSQDNGSYQEILCRPRRTKIGIEICIGMKSGTGTGPTNGTRYDSENRTVIAIKIDKKSLDMEDKGIHSVFTRAKGHI
ncbi:hypothetical protein EVAR_15807_1 [Eumeta japonica]|uniref:Uncharacterized protein n=1 Tax=Eumeta variegata TaxID=151549 RepID=A0A4C1TZM5_EUMVA|nr:hypothetical protein EVAR_15807_1 [Eumeta japonica]